MAITTQPKVEAVLNRALTAAEEGFLTERLVMAEAAIRDAFPGLVFDETAVVDEDSVVRADYEVWPSLYPLLSVEALTVNDVAVDLTDLTITEPNGPLVLPVSRFDMSAKDYGGWRAGDRVVISYTAGYPDAEPDGDPDVPAHVSTVAAEMIAVGFATPLSVRQETLGDHSVSYAGGGAAFTPEAIRKRLRSLARPASSPAQHRGSL